MSIFFLAQEVTTRAVAATQAAAPDPEYYVKWENWAKFYDVTTTVTAIMTFILTMLTGWLLSRIFRKPLEKNQLVRPLRLGTFSLALYFTLIALHPGRMTDTHDILALVFHKAFVASMVLVALRLLDRLVIIPVLTRGGKVSLSRFVHQIVIIVVSIFVILGYCSWAFHIDITSFLAGSAVISIVLGLALQETLGNFFSGMVMQASSPFVIGDWIQCNNVEGRVVDMTWRAVTLQTVENNYILIPNSIVAKEQIVNFHSPTVATARSVKIGLEYDVPPNQAREVLLQAIKDTAGVMTDPPPAVSIASFADSAVMYGLWFYIDKPQDHGAVEARLRLNAWYRLKQAGLAIPFNTQTIELINPSKKAAGQRERHQAERLETIHKVPMLAMLKPEQLTMLAEDAREHLIAAGHRMYQQGDSGDSFFILREGTIEIFARDGEGKNVSLGMIQAPSVFGEISALTGQPRPTTIQAVSDVQCMEVTRGHLQELFAADPAVMDTMSGFVAKRQAEIEAKIQELQAKAPVAHPSEPQHHVLDRMRRIFGGVLHR